MIKIKKIVRTCLACPSQWDAWDTDGKYLYIRIRHGHFTVDRYDTEERYWDLKDEKVNRETILEVEGHPLDGYMTDEELIQNTYHILDFSKAKWGK